MENSPTEYRETTNCPNCGHQLQGQFCFQCGQNQRDMNRFFWSLVNETFEDIFSLNSRFVRTIRDLTLRPGFLSSEYVNGRKARYIPPLRLYLVTSLILVLFLSIQNLLMNPSDEGPVVLDFQGSGDAAPVQISSDVEVTEAIEQELVNMKIDFLPEEQVEKLRVRIREQASKAYHVLKEEPSKLYSILLDTLPPMMFILLPLFALLMKLTYISSGRYYTEHLVFTLHNQCFVYIIILVTQTLQLVKQLADSASVMGFIADWSIFILNIWIPLYLLLSLKIFYGQGLGLTLFKFLYLCLVYSVLLMGVFMISMVWGFFTL